jgi:hypothetical protein
MCLMTNNKQRNRLETSSLLVGSMKKKLLEKEE